MPLDWDQSEEFHGLVRLYRGLVRLRLNREGAAAGLTGRHVRIHRQDEEKKLIAFHRWDRGGPGDDVVVVMNFSHQPREGYRLGLPHGRLWRLRLNTDWSGHSDDFGSFAGHDVEAEAAPCDGYDVSAEFAVGPYSTLIYSQD